MTWIQTHSGEPVDLIDPKPDQIHVADIVHALARISRFTGHTKGATSYTVAQHSVLVHRIVCQASPRDATAQLWALLHDAHEAYVGDISTPMKWALGFAKGRDPLRKLTAAFDWQIARHFGLTAGGLETVEPIVKRADLVALALERNALLGSCKRPWDSLAGVTALPDIKVGRPLRAQSAERLFLRTLTRAVGWFLLSAQIATPQ
jgi:hypothetical protein